ncbi:MAG: ATP-binding protein [Candidatus Doudnabacteria bacterium]
MNNNNREYKLNISPRVLELLGPSLYTNIYYVLAELIANAYDAMASNVYIIKKEDRIIVEDDGIGMSYEDGDIKKIP